MVGDAMVPVALLILGMQLSQTRIKGDVGVTLQCVLIRLLVSPLVMFAIVYVGNIEGLLAKVLILQHSMPTAVVMTMIAAEYKTGASLVANVTFITTLLSFFSTTGLLYTLNLLYSY
jgi:predicted permease